MDFRVFFLVICACWLLLIPAASADLEVGPLSCDFSREKSSLVNTEITNLDIEGAVLEFPQDYVFSLPFKSGELRDALLLRADVNNFSSYPKRKQYLEDGTYKQQVGIYDWMTILVGSKLPMRVMWKRILISSYNDVSHKNYNDTEIPYVPASFGLLKPDKSNENNFRQPDIFVHQHKSEVKDIITCSKVESFPFPNCSHIFEVGAYDLKITYARTELPRWKELRDGVSKLLQCFTVNEPIELPNVKIPGE